MLVPARRSAHVSAGAWKASAGALARVPVAWASNLVRALTSYQEAGLFVAGLDAQGDTDLGELSVADGPARAGRRLGGTRPVPAGRAAL